MHHRYRGVGVALITPFDSNDSIDFEGLKNLIDFVSNNNSDYLVVNGTTGESATTTSDEKKQILVLGPGVRTCVAYTVRNTSSIM